MWSIKAKEEERSSFTHFSVKDVKNVVVVVVKMEFDAIQILSDTEGQCFSTFFGSRHYF